MLVSNWEGTEKLGIYQNILDRQPDRSSACKLSVCAGKEQSSRNPIPHYTPQIRFAQLAFYYYNHAELPAHNNIGVLPMRTVRKSDSIAVYDTQPRIQL